MSNPFEAIKEIYNEEVEEADKKGNAELFANATDACMNWIKQAGFTVISIKYLDGYFVFGTGTNSVIHYTIKECPGWTFAIWWNVDDSKPNFINGEFFCEYNELIDKFKPTRCEYSYTISIHKDNINQNEPEFSFIYDHIKVLNFIAKHPIRAFYRTYCGINFNTEYVNEFKMFYKFYSFKLFKWVKNTLNNYFEKTETKFIKKNILNLCDYNRRCKAELVNMGEGWTPKYEIQCKIPDNAPEDETGCFGIFADDLTEEELNIQNRWKRLIKFHEKISDIFGFFKIYVCNNFVVYYREKDFEDDN